MTRKELSDKFNDLANKLSDIEMNLSETLQDVKRVVRLVEELPEEDDLVFEDPKNAEDVEDTDK